MGLKEKAVKKMISKMLSSEGMGEMTEMFNEKKDEFKDIFNPPKTFKVINKSNNELPRYKLKGSAGMDVRAFLQDVVVLLPGKRILIPTGLYFELEEGYEMQVRSRSGLALNHGVIVLNSPGTLDETYRGELGIILLNTSGESFTIENGDRIAQIVISKYETIEWGEVDGGLSDTERGTGGFGHTGIK